VVLVDEPFAGLTQGETAVFADLIDAFRGDGRAVLLVDHNVKSVARLVDRVMAMYLGSCIAEGSAEDVMRDPTVRRVYIGGEITHEARHDQVARAGEPLLDVRGIDVLYGKAQALQQVSLHVHAREYVAVVGLNGAGKTTLFNAISGFVPYGGAIRWHGAPLAGRSPAAIARGGIVQCPETRELFGALTVQENLHLGGQHLTRAERDRHLAWLMDLFPVLSERARQRAQTLSGGEQQMLAIARALMMRPKLLILDEPTLGLAPVILEQLSQALKRLRETTEITVLLGEQNLTFSLPLTDRVYLLEHARVVWEGEPAQFAAEMGTGYL
jgi:branched-chain amino acid transport system ATP-binding protein